MNMNKTFFDQPYSLYTTFDDTWLKIRKIFDVNIYETIYNQIYFNEGLGVDFDFEFKDVIFIKQYVY